MRRARAVARPVPKRDMICVVSGNPVNPNFTIMTRPAADLPKHPGTRRRRSFRWWPVYGFAAFAVCAALTTMGLMQRTYLHMNGPSTHTGLLNIKIGDDAFAIPVNAVRQRDQRRSDRLDRLDLLVQWPTMTGYSDGAQAHFNNPDSVAGLIFMSIQRRDTARSTSEMYRDVYAGIIEKGKIRGPIGLRTWSFFPGYGYDGEVLYVQRGNEKSDNPFAIRCLASHAPAAIAFNGADCVRDIVYGKSVLVRYRYNSSMLSEWFSIEAAVRQTLDRYAR